MSHFCSSNAVVSAMDPSTTFMQELSTNSGKCLAKNADVAGAISDGLRTTAFPAAIAPIAGSINNARDESRKGNC